MQYIVVDANILSLMACVLWPTPSSQLMMGEVRNLYMQQFFLYLSPLSLLIEWDTICKIRLLCAFGVYHTHALFLKSFSQGWSGNEDVQVVPSALFVCVLGQDKRIPYYRPAKHPLSLER